MDSLDTTLNRTIGTKPTIGGKRPASLRSILSSSILVLTLVSLFVGVSLLIVTNSLESVTRSLGGSVESILLTNATEVTLLVHARQRDPLARAQSEAAVLRNLKEMQPFVGTAAESDVLSESKLAVDAYFAATRQNPPDVERIAASLEKAFRTIEQLVEINIAQSKDAREQARQLNRIADLISISAVAVFILVVPLVLWWINKKAFRPSLSLASAMTRFAVGDWNSRAPEAGPAELREMAAHFNQMAEKLRQQRESQAAFLAGVAHDLRNPLNALRMSAAMVQADQPLPSEGKIRQTVAVVDRQVHRLERMVNDFLDMARIEAGELALSTEPHDVRETARNVADLFSDTSEQHHLELVVPDAPLWVSCDAGRIEQVLNNLTSNAIKYSPGGGHIRIVVDSHAGRVRIAVTDQGIGISREDQLGLFQPFRRAKLLGNDIAGVGLGLFLSRRIVEAHGGSIEVVSVPGHGSTFTVWLPMLSAIEPRLAPE